MITDTCAPSLHASLTGIEIFPGAIVCCVKTIIVKTLSPRVACRRPRSNRADHKALRGHAAVVIDALPFPHMLRSTLDKMSEGRGAQTQLLRWLIGRLDTLSLDSEEVGKRR